MNKIKLEYAMFGWNPTSNDYEIVGPPETTELACRTKFAERVNKRQIPSHIDINKTELRCRTVKSVRSPWKTISENQKLELSDSNGKIKVYFDMDGTLAHFNRLSTLEDLLAPGYFKNLQPLYNVVESVKLLLKEEQFEVFILSAYLRDSQYALNEKREWLRKFLPELDETHYLFIPCGRPKNELLDTLSENDILLDDYWKNLTEWHGIPVKLFNGVNGTSDRGWNGYSTSCRFHAEKIVEDIIRAANSKTLNYSPTL